MTRFLLLSPLLFLLACAGEKTDTFEQQFMDTSGGTWSVELDEGPYRTGWHTLVLYVVDGSEDPATGLDFDADVSMPGMGHGSTEDVEVSETGSGQYEVEAYFQMAGDWRVDGTFSDPSTAAEDFGFDFEVESN